MSSKLSWKIIRQFSSKNKYGFTFQDVLKEFPEKNPVHMSRILSEMVEEGILYKIARNHYQIIPLNADPETYAPDSIQVAKNIMTDKEYYIGYASALKVYGVEVKLPEAREYVVTSIQMKPSNRNLGGISYQFILHDASRFFGFSSIWVNQLEQAMVSDPEKTIVDIATRPQYCGGIIEVGNAIISMKDRTDHNKLFYYLARNENNSAKKRFLFLADILGLKWTVDHERMMQELGTGITLLDPMVPDRGKRRGEFGLKINVDPNDIKNKVLHGE